MQFLDRATNLRLAQLGVALSAGGTGEGEETYSFCSVMAGDHLLVEARAGYGDMQAASRTLPQLPSDSQTKLPTWWPVTSPLFPVGLEICLSRSCRYGALPLIV